MRRGDREVTDRRELEDILEECRVVHIGFWDEAGPFVVPMNYGFALEAAEWTGKQNRMDGQEGSGNAGV